jgi:hypothetical protein
MLIPSSPRKIQNKFSALWKKDTNAGKKQRFLIYINCRDGKAL